jgi:hypothetical protein
VGDVIRVRIRAINPVTPADETQNWEAIYDVTLQAVDPFWDVAYGAPFATYASLVLVDERTDPPSYVVPSGVNLPVPLRATVPGSRFRSFADPFAYRTAHITAARQEESHLRLVRAAPSEDLSGLPTVVEYYMNQVAREDPSVRSEMERSRYARADFLRENSHRSAAIFRHSPAHVARHSPAQPKQPHRQPPASHNSQHQRKGRQEPARRPGQHLKGRRQ